MQGTLQEMSVLVTNLLLTNQIWSLSYLVTKTSISLLVLGTKLGYVCSLGRAVKPVRSLSFVSSVDLAQRLEEARWR